MWGDDMLWLRCHLSPQSSSVDIVNQGSGRLTNIHGNWIVLKPEPVLESHSLTGSKQVMSRI